LGEIAVTFCCLIIYIKKTKKTINFFLEHISR